MYLNEDIWYIQWLYYLIDVWIYIYPKMSECITWVYLNVRRPSKCPFKWVKFPEPIGSRCSQGPGFSTWLWVKFSYAAMRRVFWWFQVPKSWPGCWFQTFLIFHNTWGVIRNPLTNSIIFRMGRSTTNQPFEPWVDYFFSQKAILLGEIWGS
jgi:hypothetical protein